MGDDGRGVRRTGVGMMVLFWVLLLLLAGWWFRGVEQRRNDPNADLAGTVSIDQAPVTLQRNARGHFVAPGEIDGHAVTLLVDTGATYVSLSRSLARSLIASGSGDWRHVVSPDRSMPGSMTMSCCSA
jgi:aspartyl protease family protein